MKRKIMLVLDSQRLEVNIPFRNVYDFVSDVLKKGRFKQAKKLVESLRKEGAEVVVVALDARTGEFFVNEKIPFVARSDVTQDLLELKYGEISFKFMRNLIKTISEVDSNATYRGILLPYLDEKNIWRTFVQPVVKSIDTFNELIKKYKPTEAYVLNSAHFYQKLFMLAAQNSGLEVNDRSGKISHLPWAAKMFAIKNLGFINYPKYFRKLKPRHLHAEKKEKKKIVIAHDTISPQKVLPWAKKLAKEYEVVYVGTSESGEEFEKAGIKYRRLKDYATESSIERAKILKRIFSKDFHKVFGHPKIRDALSFRGIDTSSALEEMFYYEYYIAYGILALYIELFNNMIAFELPDLIATVDDRSRFGRVLIETADKKGVQSLIVQHGALVDHPLFEKSSCTKYAAYGKQSEGILLKRKFRKEQIEIVGQAEDLPEESSEKIKARVCTKLNISRKKPIVVFATQSFSESINFPSFNIFYNTVKEYPEVQFVVKLHPDEKETQHRDFINKLGLENVTITKDIKVKELLIACDLLVNIYSTVGMEAIGLGKPLISINANLPASYFPKGTGAYVVRHTKHLKALINNIVIKNKRPPAESIKKASRYYVTAIGDTACNNVAKLVDKMIERK